MLDVLTAHSAVASSCELKDAGDAVSSSKPPFFGKPVEELELLEEEELLEVSTGSAGTFG